MKYRINLSSRFGHMKPLIMRPELSIYDAAYWQGYINQVGKEVEKRNGYQVRATVAVAK